MEVIHQFYNTHKFYPEWDVTYLFLGTFNPICGQQLDYYYYRRKTNGFWKILKKHFDPIDEYNIDTYEELRRFMIEKKIGCIDVICNVSFPDEKRSLICGEGFEDSTLFTVKKFIREYTFEEIKQFVIVNKTPKIFSTWGKRDKPNEFNERIAQFSAFCEQNNVTFIKLPSPSGRLYRGVNIPIITNEWINKLS
ncbi:MAG: hypothetical protein NVSMB24_18090 [Mucilaginibacter sp.]